MCVKLTLSTNDQMIQSNVVTPYMKALEKIFMKFPIGSGHLVFRHFSNGRLSKKILLLMNELKICFSKNGFQEQLQDDIRPKERPGMTGNGTILAQGRAVLGRP